MTNRPIYPIYIPSKGRWNACLTADFLKHDNVPFRIVIEEKEYKQYADIYGRENILVLPFSDKGSVIPARNWIKEHSISEGHERHWQLDDNIKRISRVYRGKRVPCESGVALRVAEDFTDRYQNIALSGLNYRFFQAYNLSPFFLNSRVYSCSLVNNSIPHKWRGRYNEDADLCLQVLADGWCTVLFNAFVADKLRTMVLTGGNTSEIYGGDGRLKMARSLERQWPGVVKTSRRFKRPQHVVHDSWRKFDTQLILKEGVSLDDFRDVDEYGLGIVKKKEIKSDKVKRMLAENKRERESSENSDSEN